MSSEQKSKRKILTVKEIVIFAMLGAIMFASKKIMEVLPNIHLLATFIIAFTVVYRRKALYPLYVYILLEGIFCGFGMWWIPYLYIWTILWGVVMLLPKHMPVKVACVVYAMVGALFGLSFGTLYAPAQALMFRLDLKGTLAWIVAGLPFDLIHAADNLISGLLIYPLIKLLRKLNHYEDC